MQKTLTLRVPGRGDLQCAFPLDRSDGSIIFNRHCTDDECLTYGGFFLGETVHVGNFKFIADYFGSMSLSPRKGDEDTTLMGSTRSGASTLRRAMIEDSIEEFLTVSSGEGSFDLPSPRRRGGFARSRHNHTMDK
jgi:hypothetical protein